MSKDDPRLIQNVLKKISEHFVQDRSAGSPEKWIRMKTFMSFFLLLACLSIFNQASAQNAGTKKISNGIQWQSDGLVNGVSFFHSIGVCNGEHVVFLKLINKNNFKVKITWKEDFVSRQVAQKTEGSFGEKELTLKAGQTSEANCAMVKQKELIVRADQVNPSFKAEILDYGFRNINVSKLQ